MTLAEPQQDFPSSLLGKKWLFKPHDEREATMLSQRLQLPEVIGRLLSCRNISLEQAPHFLDPSIRHFLPDPSHLKDMDKAAERISSLIISGKTIGLFGDYDVDGATSVSLLHLFIESAGGKIVDYIPDRMKEGYGPNIIALQKLKDQGAETILTLDCGTTSFDVLEKAAENNIEVIVIDHHISESALPIAFAVVNPNRFDQGETTCKNLAAVGVCFLLAVAINRCLRDQGHYKERPEPDLLSLLDLVALGTVCDVVQLEGLNRAFVTQGLKVMAKRQNLGMKTLADIGGVDEAPTAYHLGFILGPRINAGGRIGKADMGKNLLTTTAPEKANMISVELDRLNHERREIEAKILEEALEMAAKKATDGVIIVASKDWHPGVIGIVASRLTEKYHRPTCVISFFDGYGKGSARSIKGFSFGNAIIAAKQAGLLVNGGGHDMAAGLTIEPEKVDGLEAFLNERFHGEIHEDQLVERVYIDGVINTSTATRPFCETLEQLAPFGMGNAEPRFLIRGVRVSFSRIVGTDHVSAKLTNGGERTLNAIGFRMADTALGQAILKANKSSKIDLVGKLRLNRWQGYITPQFQIEDGIKVL